MDNTIECEISFNTPALLGDAQQRANWRTPAIKSALRAMWRIHYASHHPLNVDAMREREGELFGQVLGNTPHKSRVLLRLSQWGASSVDLSREVKNLRYAGYGAVENSSRTMIKPEDPVTLRIIVCDKDGINPADVEASIRLMAQFTCLGAKARNGFGSLNINGDLVDLSLDEIKQYARNIDDCLNEDWPHAVGKDHKGILIWRTKEVESDPQKLLRQYETLKKDYRNEIKNISGDMRYMIGLPLDTGKGGFINSSERLSSQISFKVLRVGDGFVGQVTHFPVAYSHGLAGQKPSMQQQLTVWQKVHDTIDNHPNFARWQGE